MRPWLPLLAALAAVQGFVQLLLLGAALIEQLLGLDQAVGEMADAAGPLAVLHAWIATALELGASVEDPPRQAPFGAVAWLLDPEGYRLLLLNHVLPCA
jgi:hypothetical protein